MPFIVLSYVYGDRREGGGVVVEDREDNKNSKPQTFVVERVNGQTSPKLFFSSSLLLVGIVLTTYLRD